MQSGLDPAVWSEVFGGAKPVNLSSFGDSPLPTLEHLAGDASFAGSIICECAPFVVFNEEWGGGANLPAFELARRSPSKWVEARLSAWVNGNLVIRRSELSFRRGLEIAWNGWAPADVVDLKTRAMRGDRFYPIDFVGRTDDGRAPGPDFKPPEAKAASGGPHRQLLRLERAVTTILERGGRVLLVAFPNCGRRGAYESAMYPREVFWDPLQDRLGIPTIHYLDYPDLAGFDCPDGSHLDRGSTRPFTTALARRVMEAWQDLR